MHPLRLVPYLWTAPNTLLGLLLVPVAWCSGGTIELVHGVLEVHGRFIAWLLRRMVPLPGGAAALTLGHVVIGRDTPTLAACRRHEAVHVAQYERWGPFFIPAYFMASAIAYLRGGDPYRDNVFERAAFMQEGR